MNPQDKSLLRGCSYIMVRVVGLAAVIWAAVIIGALFGGPIT